jgi:D-alanyl-D-alanine carboxypeptidase
MMIPCSPIPRWITRNSSLDSGSSATDIRIAGNTLKDRGLKEVTYYGQGQGPYDDPYAINVTRMDSHGGWIAPPVDLVRFATHVDGFDVSRSILKAETIRRMRTLSAVNGNYARGWKVTARATGGTREI